MESASLEAGSYDDKASETKGSVNSTAYTEETEESMDPDEDAETYARECYLRKG
jgi:hypothetical protein